MANTKKQIVIVGGGIAGATLARALSKDIASLNASLTLVNARPFFISLPASIRMTTTAEGNLEEHILIPYDNLFYNGNGTVIIGRVTAVEVKQGSKGGSLLLADGTQVPYDILVLAPGNTWSGPIAFPDDRDEVLDHIRMWREKFAGAKNVVMVGGGAVGIEYAGELRDFYPEKNVTIVHSDRLLMNAFFPDKFRKRIEGDIRAAGAEVLLEDSIDTTEAEKSATVTTRAGRKIDADLIVPTFGGKPATEFLRSMGDDILSSTGHIRVKKTLQLLSHPDIFAMGDAIESTESRQVLPVNGHIAVITANILAQLKNEPVTKEYNGAMTVIAVCNGRYRGAMYIGILWGISLGNWFTSKLKGRDLMVSKTRAGLGIKDA